MTIRSIDRIGRWCAGQHAATCDNVFGPETDVYRLSGKIFAMVNLDDAEFVTLKADPDEALALRQQHNFIRPGHYMNKRHWITVDAARDVPLDLVHELVDDSCALILASLARAQRDVLDSTVTNQSPGP